MTKYLQLNWKTSDFYEYSKDQKPGFEPHTNTKGEVSYRDYKKEGVIGTLASVGVKDSQVGQQLVTTLKDDSGDYVNVQLGLYDQKGNVENNFAESLIRFLGNMKKGVKYRLYPYHISKEDQKESDIKEGKELREKYYDSRGISVKEVTETGMVKVDPAYLYNKRGEKDPTRVPSLEYKVDPTGKNRPSAVTLEQKNDFILGKLMESVDGHLKYENNSSSETQRTNKPQETKFETVDVENTEFNHSDLPF